MYATYTLYIAPRVIFKEDYRPKTSFYEFDTSTHDIAKLGECLNLSDPTWETTHSRLLKPTTTLTGMQKIKIVQMKKTKQSLTQMVIDCIKGRRTGATISDEYNDPGVTVTIYKEHYNEHYNLNADQLKNFKKLPFLSKVTWMSGGKSRRRRHKRHHNKTRKASRK